MNIKTQKHILLWSFFVLIVLGMLSGYMYQTSPERTINLSEFQRELHQKEMKAIEALYDIQEIYSTSTLDSLINYPFPGRDIAYFILEDDELVFWSDNHLDISDISLEYYDEWEYVDLPNAYAIAFSRIWDDVEYLAVVTIKNDYPYENDKLVNDFAADFNMDKRVGVYYGYESDDYAVYSNRGQYLFSMELPQEPVYNKTWSALGCSVFFLAFIFLFLIYARFPAFMGKKYISVKNFLFLFLGFGVIISLLLYFDIPDVLFKHELFSSFHYASGSFLASICHLTIFTGFVFSSVCLFFSFVKIKRDNSKIGYKDVLLLLLCPLYFMLLYFVLNSLVFDSCIHTTIFSVNDFTWLGVWSHFLLLVWGVGFVLLFFKTHKFYCQRRILSKALIIDAVLFCLLIGLSYWLFSLKSLLLIIPYLVLTISLYLALYSGKYKNTSLYLIVWSLLYAAFVSVNLIQLNLEKDKEKYHVLARNVYVNGNVENDRIADVLLVDLDAQLKADEKIRKLMTNIDSIEVVKKYLNETYFRGFWNKYDVRLNATMQSDKLYQEYLHYTEHVGTKIKGTHFYSVPTTQNSMTYIGIFPAMVSSESDESLYYYMEFYPRRQYKSYSFPDLLIPSSAEIHSKLNVSIAKYDKGFLTYSSGEKDFPYDPEWASENYSEYKTFNSKRNSYYVYRPNDDTAIVISKKLQRKFPDYLQFFTYLTLFYFFFIWITKQVYQLLFRRDEFSIGLAARFQYTFILLFIISFIAIFYASVDFIKIRYQNQQIAILESKRNYIQEALQEKYYWNQELDMHNASALNFDLQDMSYTYQTDIHVFDNNGVLLGSSQPLIFYRDLISDRMASKPYFSADPNIEQYENIGDLTYLVAYTNFYNWDYLQIGYIAVPQFFSQEDMRAEIENFSSVIINIYLIIILIAILLAIFIGKRLSAPLSMLERKLREMRIGRRNEKIEYHQNDEIGHLVAQYNRTVDELEQSARLLAKSERESAWKSMARQVAHEINNPLTPMKLSIQQLQRRKNMDDEGFDEYFKNSTDMLIEQIDSLSRIAATFSNFARMPEANISRIDIAVTLQSVIRLFANNSRHIKILYDGAADGVCVNADSEQLAQVFNNLIKNALQAIPESRAGLVLVKLQSNDEKVIISVSDNGTGVASEVRDKVFVPNFTTKAKGMGLGLAISKSIIEQVGGTITYKTTVGEGSTFVVEIPLCKEG